MTATRRPALQSATDINGFLVGVEKRAYRIAKIAVGNREDALDILQDSMCKLVEKYAGRAADEWPALFHTILQSRIRDWYRRETVRNRFRVWFGRPVGSAESGGGLEDIAADDASAADAVLQTQQFMQRLEPAIRALPWRQQQAFMLRLFEEFDVRQTAAIMGCSESSVKTHYSRAVTTLRAKLGGEGL